jgi:hypothetical protein
MHAFCVSLRLEHAGGSHPDPHVRAVGRQLFGGTYKHPWVPPRLMPGKLGGVKTLRPVWLTPVLRHGGHWRVRQNEIYLHNFRRTDLSSCRLYPLVKRGATALVIVRIRRRGRSRVVKLQASRVLAPSSRPWLRIRSHTSGGGEYSTRMPARCTETNERSGRTAAQANSREMHGRTRVRVGNRTFP